METKIPIEIVELENDENLHPVIEAKINGNPIRLVIDTGASHTCIDKNEVKKLLKNKKNVSNDIVMGVGTKALKNTIINIKELTIGDLEINDYNVVVIKLSHINKMMEMLGIPPVNGLLGSDILYKHKAIIDYENCCLTLKI